MSVEHTEKILKELYEFMGIPLDLESKNRTWEYLLHGESRRSTDSNEDYYGLLRGDDFDPNHWTKQLKEEVK